MNLPETTSLCTFFIYIYGLDLGLVLELGLEVVSVKFLNF